MLLAVTFPAIDPVAIALGPLAIRWYALAYVAGLVLGWRAVRGLAHRHPGVMSDKDVDDLLLWATVGVVVGGRLGYVLVYNPGYYIDNLGDIFAIWQGGMSFHGGLVGVTVAIIVFCRMRKLRLLRVADLVACQVPIGLFFGRIANFINGELWGRPTDAPWGMIFPDPRAGGIPRHPAEAGHSDGGARVDPLGAGPVQLPHLHAAGSQPPHLFRQRRSGLDRGDRI